ncbi:MAG: SH3 domain-containing protein [Mogibacterium sp.]|nr:SH3 domain-containing protein [Mogibacterium sp.]
MSESNQNDRIKSMKTYRSWMLTLLLAVAFVMLASVSASAVSVGSATGTINFSGELNVRAQAGTSSKVVMTIKGGSKVTILEEQFVTRNSTAGENRWYKIKYNGKTGYVRSTRIKNIKYSSVKGKLTAQSNYRYGAGTGMKKKGSFAKNKEITIVLNAKAKGSTKVWYKIKSGSKYYYIAGTSVKLLDTKTEEKPTISVGTATGKINFDGELNVRASASTSSKIVTKVKGGAKVTILEEQFTTTSSTASENRWYKIKYNGKIGYVRSNRIKNIKYTSVKGKLTAASNYRYGAGTGMKKKGSFAKNKELTIVLKAKAAGSTKVWYKIKTGGKYFYIASTSVKLIDSKAGNSSTTGGSALSSSPYDGVDFEAYLDAQGFPESYKVKLRALHKAHPKWVFVAQKVDYDFAAAVNKECADGVSLVHSSYPVSYRDTGANSYVASAGVTVETEEDPIETEEAPVEAESDVPADGAAAPADEIQPEGTESGTEAEPVVPEEETEPAAAEDNEATEPAAEEATETQDPVPDEAPEQADTPVPEEADPTAAAEDTMVPEEEATDRIIVTAAEASPEQEEPQTEEEANGPQEEIAEQEPSEALPPDESEDQTEQGPAESEPAEPELLPEEPDTSDTVDGVSEDTGTDAEESGTQTETTVPETTEPVVTAQGTYIPKDGSSWYNASKKVVQYYMDPRNFLNEDRIYMFEDLTYHKYHTAATVQKIIAGTALAKAGYMPVWFVNAGKKYNISPISLAARARSEVGGGSIACSGYKIDGVTYYNPFNIGAYSGSNPVMNGMKYAQKHGWDTKEKAINGGAALLSDSYLKNNQNTLYFQRFNVANGLGKVATHQYMTNIMAPYTESYSTKTSYATYGILDEQLIFIIPVYKNMPDKTSLPK